LKIGSLELFAQDDPPILASHVAKITNRVSHQCPVAKRFLKQAFSPLLSKAERSGIKVQFISSCEMKATQTSFS
jgi:hypothetical protein